MLGIGGEAVRVIARLRPEESTVDPIAGRAADGGQHVDLSGSCVLSREWDKLTVVDPGSHNIHREENHAHEFKFDRVFGPAATQDEVFDTVKPLVHATVDGECLVGASAPIYVDNRPP